MRVQTREGILQKSVWCDAHLDPDVDKKNSNCDGCEEDVQA